MSRRLVMTRPGAALAGAARVALGVALGLGACGGSKKEAAVPVEEESVEDEAPPDDSNDELISGRTLDEIRSYFDRRARTAARCYGEAVEAGELKEPVTVRLDTKISPSGQLTNVEFTLSAPSETLERCMREQSERWTAPGPVRELDYSYTFSFDGV